MNLAQQAWERTNLGRVRQLLDETTGYLERGFEWFYWQRQTHLKLRTLRGHLDAVWAVAFSPDGQRMVTASADHTAKVWETDSGKELFTLKGHNAAVVSVAISPDGQRMVTGSHDEKAKVWDAANGKELFTLAGHSAPILAVAISQDGQRIVTASEDGAAKVWDAANGKVLLTLAGDRAPILAAAVSPDGQRIVTVSEDGTAKVWDAASSKVLFPLAGHAAPILAVAVSPDGQRIVTGSRDQTAKIWEAVSGQELLTLQGHTAYISSVAFSPDGQRVITGSGDQTAKVWKAATADEVALWQREEKDAAEHLAERSRERAAVAEHERALRAQDPGVIKQWLVLAPIAYEGRSGAVALAQEQVPHEANLQARASERIQVGESERGWQAVRLDDYQLDFNELLKANICWSVAYAVCYIESDANRSGLLMKVGSDDQSKVYLNRKEIYRCEKNRSYRPDQNVVTGVELKAGLNVLVFKVVNQTGDWVGSIRFTDAAGQPLKGIRVALDPGKRDL